MTSLFNKIAGDITGAAEVGKVIPKASFGTEESIQRYVPVKQTALFYVKSGVQELIVTDHGMILSTKSASLSAKRHIRTFSFAHDAVSEVYITSPGFGITDLDLELSFTIGTHCFSDATQSEINIWKSDMDKALKLYQALNAVSAEQKRRGLVLQMLSGSDGVSLDSAEKASASLTASFSDVISPFVV